MRMSFLCLLTLISLLVSDADALWKEENGSFVNAELGPLLNRIAFVGKFHIVIDPHIVRNRLSWSGKEAAPLAALHAIAKAAGYRVKRFPSRRPGGMDCYAVAGPEVVTTCCSAYTRAIRLRHATADSVAPLLRRLVGEAWIECDTRTNILVVAGSEADAGRVATIAFTLDSASRYLQSAQFVASRAITQAGATAFRYLD